MHISFSFTCKNDFPRNLGGDAHFSFTISKGGMILNNLFLARKNHTKLQSQWIGLSDMRLKLVEKIGLSREHLHGKHYNKYSLWLLRQCLSMGLIRHVREKRDSWVCSGYSSFLQQEMLAGKGTLKLKLYFLAWLYVSHLVAALGVVQSLLAIAFNHALITSLER